MTTNERRPRGAANGAGGPEANGTPDGRHRAAATLARRVLDLAYLLALAWTLVCAVLVVVGVLR